MPHPKVKSEMYTNLGGINTKISPYIMGPHEFLNLVNYDFQTPGSLSTRYGSTQYITTSASFVGQITSLFEFSKTTGFSTVVFSHSGSIWNGATTGDQAGLSLTALSATLLYNFQVPFVSYVGGAFTLGGTQVPFVTGFQAGKFYGLGSTFAINSISQGQNKFDYAVLNNNLFMCDGTKFLRFDGTTAWPVGLPYATAAVIANGFTVSTGQLPNNAVYDIYASYVNNNNYEGPIFPLGRFALTADGATMVALTGSTKARIDITVNTPLSYGINSVNVYLTNTSGNTFGVDLDIYTQPLTYIYNQVWSGSTITTVSVGFSAVTFSGDTPNVQTQTNNLFGFTFQPIGSAVGASRGMFQVQTSFYPQYIETYQNRLFLSGFSAQPSTMYFSETGEPENYAFDEFIEVRTNDGDKITAMKAYQSKLMVFKKNSFHELAGDSIENFNLREVSDQYGCISNRAVTIYDDVLVFLDRKGLMMYNGANIESLSTKIQPIFDSMNQSAAEGNATMAHDKSRNQIMLGIPVSGSITNNVTVVYDYLNNAFTTYEGYSPAVFAVIQGRLNNQSVFYGGYSGMFYNMGSSLIGDNGIGFTCLFQTRFLSQFGQSTEGQFRRLYLNVDPVTSATVPITINLQANYGSSFVVTRTMYANPFQSRIDFGIPAKSMAILASYVASTLSIKVHGYSTDTRYQRST